MVEGGKWTGENAGGGWVDAGAKSLPPVCTEGASRALRVATAACCGGAAFRVGGAAHSAVAFTAWWTHSRGLACSHEQMHASMHKMHVHTA